jgi:transcriptional regulator with XRE-family HTH domain
MIRALDRTALGRRLTARMRELGIAQKDLAVRLHVDPGQISVIRHGHVERPNLELLWQIAKELDISLDYLVEGDPATGNAIPPAEWPEMDRESSSGYRTIAESLAAFLRVQANDVFAPIARAIEQETRNTAEALAVSHAARRPDTGAARA